MSCGSPDGIIKTKNRSETTEQIQKKRTVIPRLRLLITGPSSVVTTAAQSFDTIPHRPTVKISITHIMPITHHYHTAKTIATAISTALDRSRIGGILFCSGASASAPRGAARLRREGKTTASPLRINDTRYRTCVPKNKNIPRDCTTISLINETRGINHKIRNKDKVREERPGETSEKGKNW